MAKVKNIKDEEHVARHCKAKQTIRHHGAVVGIHPDHFLLRPPSRERPEPEQYLSGIWFEGVSAPNDQQRCLACTGCPPMPFALKPDDVVSILSVGALKTQGEKRKLKLRVTHEPSARAPLYAAIRQVPLDNDHELCALFAQEAVVRILDSKGAVAVTRP